MQFSVFMKFMPIFFTCLLCFGSLSAQTEFRGFAVNPGVGIYYNTEPDDAGFLVGLQLSKLKNQTIYSVDFYSFGEFTLMDPIPGNTYNQLGLMVGKSNRHKYFRLRYQGGIAPFFGKMYSENIIGEPGSPDYSYYKTDRIFTLALIGKMGLKILLTKNFAIGADLHVNINSKSSLIFPTVGLEIGKLKQE
jgi:hypothetical protein